MKRQFQGLAVAVGVVLMIMTMAMPAHATLTIQINGGTVEGVSQCTASDTTCNASGSTSEILWRPPGPFGTITVQGSTTTSASPIAALTLSGTLTPSSPSSITFDISDTNFANPGPPLILDQNANANDIGGKNGPAGSISATGYFAQSNTLFDTSGPNTGSTGNIPIGSAEVDVFSPPINGTTPYSMTSVITVQITDLGSTLTKDVEFTANLTANAVPEPTSVALLGGILLVMVGAIRRKLGRA